jgi:spore maturation protein CgeB
MEALSSGAMVMADETLVLPRGLRHAESLVIFESFSDFREKLLYYLRHDDARASVAKRGWEIAMGYHRSWHAMESVLFGQPVTNAGDAMVAFQKDLLPRKLDLV